MTDLLEFRRLGLDLVQPQEPNGVWESLSWEQATRYPADLVLADNRANVLTPAQLNEIPTWRELPAVRAGQVGPWQAEARLTFDGFAGILDELAVGRRPLADGRGALRAPRSRRGAASAAGGEFGGARIIAGTVAVAFAFQIEKMPGGRDPRSFRRDQEGRLTC